MDRMSSELLTVSLLPSTEETSILQMLGFQSIFETLKALERNLEPEAELVHKLFTSSSLAGPGALRQESLQN